MTDRLNDESESEQARSRPGGEAMVIRCFFMRDGHFVGVEILSESSWREATQRAAELFKLRAAVEQFDGFEVWEGDYLIYQTNGLAVRAPSRT